MVLVFINPPGSKTKKTPQKQTLCFWDDNKHYRGTTRICAIAHTQSDSNKSLPMITGASVLSYWANAVGGTCSGGSRQAVASRLAPTAGSLKANAARHNTFYAFSF